MSKQGKPYAEIVPERRYYDVRTMTMSEVGLDAGFWGDLYIVMGDNLGKVNSRSACITNRLFAGYGSEAF